MDTDSIDREAGSQEYLRSSDSTSRQRLILRASELIPHRPTQRPSLRLARPQWPPPRSGREAPARRGETAPGPFARLSDEVLPGEGRLPKDTSLDLQPPSPLSRNAWGIATCGAPKGCCAKGGEGVRWNAIRHDEHCTSAIGCEGCMCMPSSEFVHSLSGTQAGPST